MTSRYIKIGLVALLFIFSVYQFYLVNIGWGILLLLLAGIVTVTIFWHEIHLLVMLMMRRQKMKTAEKLLSKIKHPERLPKGQEAFHYFLLGTVESNHRNVGKAETLYRRALKTGLKSKTNQAVAKLNLAAACMHRRRKTEAITHLREAKKLDKYGMLHDQIKMIEQHMKRM